MLEVAADPKHLGAQIGFLLILHPWGQNLLASSRSLCHPGRRSVLGSYQLGARKYLFFFPVKRHTGGGFALLKGVILPKTFLARCDFASSDHKFPFGWAGTARQGVSSVRVGPGYPGNALVGQKREQRPIRPSAVAPAVPQ